MFELIFRNLSEFGWTLVVISENWFCAINPSQKRGLFLGEFKELPRSFDSWIDLYPEISKWDVLINCQEGVNSQDLKLHSYPDIQLWFWDTQQGNLFPSPPTKDRSMYEWLRKLSAGESVDLLGKNTVLEKPLRPYMTYTLLAINFIVFILMTLAGGSTNSDVLIKFGAKVNTLILKGEVWRLISSMFIHIGILHLIFNQYALWMLGPFSEGIYGRRKFLMIYLLCGIGGSIASFVFSSALSAGASGAIFGLLGALLYYSYKRPNLWKTGLGLNLIVVILVNFGLGLTQQGIDNFAHLGGLLTGILISFGLSFKSKVV